MVSPGGIVILPLLVRERLPSAISKILTLNNLFVSMTIKVKMTRGRKRGWDLSRALRGWGDGDAAIRDWPFWLFLHNRSFLRRIVSTINYLDNYRYNTSRNDQKVVGEVEGRTNQKPTSGLGGSGTGWRGRNEPKWGWGRGFKVAQILFFFYFLVLIWACQRGILLSHHRIESAPGSAQRGRIHSKIQFG